MNPQRILRAGTPIEVSVLVAVALVLGAGCFAAAAFPLADDAPRTLMAAFGAASIAVAAALVIAGPGVPPVALHGAVVALVLIRTAMVVAAATERGLMLGALGFIWTAVYVAYFFAPATARRYAAFMTAALGAGLLLARAPTDASVWVAISAMMWVAILILANLNSRLRAQAHCDGLTGVLNRTGFAFAAARQRAMSRRAGEPVAAVMIDLDGFKDVNDHDGHAAGDRLLVELAGVWTGSLRPGDLLARFGGDEFVLLLPVDSADQVDAILQRLRRAHPAPWTAGTVICAPDEPLDAAIARADQRLYIAKRLAARSPGRQATDSAPWWPEARAAAKTPG